MESCRGKWSNRRAPRVRIWLPVYILSGSLLDFAQPDEVVCADRIMARSGLENVLLGDRQTANAVVFGTYIAKIHEFEFIKFRVLLLPLGK